MHAKRGGRIERGQPLADVHAATDAAADFAVREVLSAYTIQDTPVRARPVLLEVIR